MDLSIGFSPCPNDTFIFHALVHGRVGTNGLRFVPRLEDVETLNHLAHDGALDVTKASYGAIPYLFKQYALLRSGGALGRGCGPLLVAREGFRLQDLPTARIAIPGRYTTANLLLRLWNPNLPDASAAVYSEIMPAVAEGRADAGLIIHESRFTYRDHGLIALQDLGEWWETTTGLPIPLGGILARRDYGPELLERIEVAISDSVRHARSQPSDSEDYVSAHAREMDAGVARRHIQLYVNTFSEDLGDLGERAVRELLKRASAAGFAPAAPDPFR